MIETESFANSETKSSPLSGVKKALVGCAPTAISLIRCGPSPNSGLVKVRTLTAAGARPASISGEKSCTLRPPQ
jgi:hypothetical protein